MFGALYLGEQELLEAELKSLTMVCQQNDMLCTITVRKAFVNQKRKALNCQFIYSLDIKMCAYDLRFIVDGREIIPKLKPKKDSENIHKEVSKKVHTVLVENFGKEFRSYHLGNLPPGRECNVEQKICLMAALTQSGYDLKIPLKILYVNDKMIKITPPKEFFMFLNITSQFEIESVEAINFTIDERSKNSIALTLREFPAESAAINVKTIVKNMQRKIGIQAGEYTAIGLIPSLENTEVPKNEFVFLIDCSASMRHSPIKEARNCLRIIVKSLPIGSRFTIIRFDSFCETLVPMSEYNDESVIQALYAIDKMTHTSGMTDLSGPLKMLLREDPEKGITRNIIVITDGRTDESNECIAACSDSRGSRVFAIGIDVWDPAIIQGMSEFSGGISALSSIDDIDIKAVEMLKSAFTLHADGMRVFINGKESIETSPYPPPILYNNVPLTFIAKVSSKSSDSVLITANDHFEVGFKAVRKDELERDLQALFSYETIRRMQFRVVNGEDLLIDEIIKLSLSSGVRSKYVGIDSEVVLDQSHSDNEDSFRSRAYNFFHRRAVRIERELEIRNKIIENLANSDWGDFEPSFSSDSFEEEEEFFFLLHPPPRGFRVNDYNSLLTHVVYKQRADGSWKEIYAKDENFIIEYGKKAAVVLEAVRLIKMFSGDKIAAFDLIIAKALTFLYSLDKSIHWESITDSL